MLRLYLPNFVNATMSRTRVKSVVRRSCQIARSALFREASSSTARNSRNVRLIVTNVLDSLNEEFCQQQLVNYQCDRRQPVFTSKLFSMTSNIRSQCDPGTFCNIGARCRKTAVSSLSTSSARSSSDAIHCAHAFMRLTARCCGRKITSESGSGAVTTSRRSNHNPSVFAFEARTPSILAANSFRYRSKSGGSGAYWVMENSTARDACGASYHKTYCC